MLIKLSEVIKTYRRKCGISNLTVNDIHGIDINKQFFSPTKQVGKNTSNYLIVPINFFACNLMHVGRDGSIPLALNKFQKDIIVSGAYFIFENIRKDIILDDFLFLYLSRPEFDRLSTFNTDSSVRDGLSWDRFIDVNIEVPSIEIQQKYVDVYNALVANQKAYENGLEDLKLVYENQFEEAQKKYKKTPLINHITERREINTNGKITNLRGISQNGLIPPNQKRSKESMKKTKIFYLNDIIYAPSSLKNGAVVLNKEYHQALCSEEYIVFRVKEDLLPEYVFILLKRKELGRYIDFLSVDSVRNRFYFADLEILDIALVPLDLQQSIVEIYRVYETRKEINEKLKQQIKEICPVLIKGAIQESKGGDLMHYKFSESSFEEVVLKLFEEADYEYVSGYDLHRMKNEIILEDDFINYLTINYPQGNFSNDDYRIILNELKLISHRNLHTSFKETLNKIRNGFTLYRETENPIHINFINYKDETKNTYKVVNQFEVQGSQELRRPDIVIFINGIPISVIELKNPADETVSVFQAYKDLTIKCNRGIPDLMRYSFVSMISDNANTLVGSIFAGYEHFYEWKSTDGDDYAKTPFEVLEMTIGGLYKHSTILNIIQNYVYIPDNDEGKSVVIVPKYYQYYHTEVLYQSVINALKPDGDGKGGTYFGATGSGKSFIMLFLTRRLTFDSSLNNPTVLLITDRADLDDQLSKTFVNSKTFLNDQNIKSFESRTDLKMNLDGISSGGVFLTTVQKFNEDTSLLTERNNVICISDEAHRSQINLNEVLELNNDEIVKRVGFAKHLRDSLPNATYVGFTGTPVDETISVFGEVAASYQMRRAKLDGATVGLEYVPGPDELKLDEQKIREIEAFYEEMEKIGTNEYQIEKSKKESANVKTIVNNPKRLKNVATHFVALYEKRVEEAATVHGKAMFICYDREVAFNFYNELKLLRPEWFVKKANAEDVEVKEENRRDLLPLEKVQLVATRAARDSKELYDLLGTKSHRETLAKEFKKIESNFKIAILVDMWITGFDVPSLDTIYIDKPLHRHSLIQTISRVNRIFKGKEKGVIVDYIGIKTALAKALKQYGGDIPAIEQNIQVAIQIFKDQLSLINEMFHEFDLSDFYSDDKVKQLRLVNNAANFISTFKESERKFMNHTKALKSALDICVGSKEVTEDEINRAHLYFIVRSIIFKLNSEGTPDVEKMNRQVKKLVDEALDSELDLANLDSVERTDLFSDEYLDTIKNIKYPTTKLKALLYLLKKIVGKYKQVNIIKGMEFEERLKQLVHKYNNRDQLVFAGEVMDEVLDSITKEIENTIKEVQADAKSFDKLGITFEEKAFYDILKSIRDKTPFEYSEDRLIKLAKTIKKVVDNQTKYTDFDKREDIRNALRSDIIRTLSRHGYPPVTATEVYDKVFETAQNFKKYN